MKIRFLLDENLDPDIKAGLLGRDPMIDIRCIGIEDLYLLWEASEAEEWRDLVAWLPL